MSLAGQVLWNLRVMVSCARTASGAETAATAAPPAAAALRNDRRDLVAAVPAESIRFRDVDISRDPPSYRPFFGHRSGIVHKRLKSGNEIAGARRATA